MARCAAIVHLFGTSRLQESLSEKKRRNFSDEAQKPMSEGLRAYSTLCDNRKAIPGLTPNSVSSAFPEIGLIIAGMDQSRPVPSLLQLPFKEDSRKSLEAMIDTAIGPDKSQKEVVSTEAGVAARKF